jgi:hypothetical protein
MMMMMASMLLIGSLFVLNILMWQDHMDRLENIARR